MFLEEIAPDSNNYFKDNMSLQYLVEEYIIAYYPASFYNVYLDIDYEARQIIDRKDHEISMVGYPLARAIINENKVTYINLYDDDVIGVCDIDAVVGSLICARDRMIEDFKRAVDGGSAVE